MFHYRLFNFLLPIRLLVLLYFLWFLGQKHDIYFPGITSEVLTLTFLLENIFVSALSYYSIKRINFIYGVIILDILTGIFYLACFKGNQILLPFLILPVLSAAGLGFRPSLFSGLILSVIYVGFLEFNSSSYAGFSIESAFLGVVMLSASATCGLLKDVYDQKTHQSNSLLSLIEAGQELGTTATYDTVFNLMTTIVKGLFGTHTCVIFLRDPREEIMKVKFVGSPYEKLFIDFDPFVSKSIVAKAIKDKKSINVEDLHLQQEEELIPKAKLMRSIMVVPFVFQDNIFGAALIAHQIPKHFDKESLSMFTVLGNQAAISLRNIQLHETTATMAVTDSVSGLFTHGYFQDHLEKEFQRCKYANLSLSLLILDVDYFKRINDTYGHPQGDAILRQLGGVIKSVTRLTDVVCRYGGDEFTVILSETNRIGAVLVAERIRQAVEDYEFVSGGKVLHISVSGGVACFPEDIATKKELIDKSDQALYEAKKQGRNRICFSA